MNRKLLTILIIIVIILNVGVVATLYFAPKNNKSTYDTDDTANDNDKTYADGYFTRLNDWSDIDGSYHIVYANDTKVKYMIIISSKRYGITPLYNADGTLQVYKEGESSDSTAQ